MIHLRNIQAASTSPSTARQANDPLLDPRTAAYLEPPTLPAARPFRLRLARRLQALRSARPPRAYPHLHTGLLFFLILLLYLLAYAQDGSKPGTPYLVVAPQGASHQNPARQEPFLVRQELAQPSLPLPITGR